VSRPSRATRFSAQFLFDLSNMPLHLDAPMQRDDTGEFLGSVLGRLKGTFLAHPGFRSA
jgi:hypothetical protein